MTGCHGSDAPVGPEPHVVRARLGARRLPTALLLPSRWTPSDGPLPVLLDPYGGQADLAAKVLRTVSPTSFAEDPLRLVRGLRFISTLDLDPDARSEERSA